MAEVPSMYKGPISKAEKEVWPRSFSSPAHTDDEEGGLRVLDVAAVARNAGVAPRVFGGHVMDHQGAILEDVHPARREATALPTSPAPGRPGCRRGGVSVGGTWPYLGPSLVGSRMRSLPFH